MWVKACSDSRYAAPVTMLTHSCHHIFPLADASVGVGMAGLVSGAWDRPRLMIPGYSSHQPTMAFSFATPHQTRALAS